MMKRLRLLITGVLLLLLGGGGAIVNVAVAWGCYLYRSFLPNQRAVNFTQRTSDVWIDSWQYCRLGYTLYRYSESQPIPLSAGSFICGISWFDVAPVNSVADSLPYGVRLIGTRPSSNQFESAGLPFRAIYCDETRSPWDISEAVMVAQHLAGKRSYSTVSLPWHPLIGGFAINTVFYAAMLWVVFFVPGMVKRTLRRRRGLCPACAYPIGTSPVCTECGAAVGLFAKQVRPEPE